MGHGTWHSSVLAHDYPGGRGVDRGLGNGLAAGHASIDLAGRAGHQRLNSINSADLPRARPCKLRAQRGRGAPVGPINAGRSVRQLQCCYPRLDCGSSASNFSWTSPSSSRPSRRARSRQRNARSDGIRISLIPSRRGVALIRSISRVTSPSNTSVDPSSSGLNAMNKYP